MADIELDELEPFVIKEVEDLPQPGEKPMLEGHGAYGIVFKVTARGLPCIAKRVHDILVSQKRVSKEERESMIKKFRNECLVLSRLRHPNIVHFVGVHYGVNGEKDLSLIMERLDCDLGEFVGTRPNLPLPVKLSILLDVSYGLLYLHNQTPQIIHRDLSVQNVLMTNEGQAKIADLGVAKLLDPTAQASIAHTTNPGNYYYMPPEALLEHAQCSTKLDIFSFGHLALYTLNQETPSVFEVTMTPELKVKGTQQAERRKKALECIGSTHSLYPLIMWCLRDDPNERPTTSLLNETLKEICTREPKRIQHTLQMCEVDCSNGSGEGDLLLKWKLQEAQKTIEDQKHLLSRVQSEKDDILSQLEILQQQVKIYKDDFEEERKDREEAHSKLADLEMKEKELKDRIARQQEMKKRNKVWKWRAGSASKDEAMALPSPTEMADRKREEMEKQYRAEKEILLAQNGQLTEEVSSLRQLNHQLSEEVTLAKQLSTESSLASSSSVEVMTLQIAELEKLLETSERKVKELQSSHLVTRISELETRIKSYKIEIKKLNNINHDLKYQNSLLKEKQNNIQENIQQDSS